MSDTKTAPEAQAETPEIAAAEQVQKPTRIPQNGIVKPEDLGPIADAFLKYVFPEESKQINADSKYGQKNAKTGKNEVSGYRSQYIINALNEIIGPGNWREYGKMETEKPATAYVSIYSGTLEIGNWKNETRIITEDLPNGGKISTPEKYTYFEVLARFEQIGGSRNMEKWESMKGAKTNFLKKVASYISNGWKSYALVMDEDWDQAPYEAEKNLPAPRQPSPANAGQQPTKPAAATAELITQTEVDQITNNFIRLGYTPEELPERIKNLEGRMKKTLAEFTAGEARDILKKMESDIQKKKNEPTPGPTDVMGATSFEDTVDIE
jgi:hypothetical protein